VKELDNHTEYIDFTSFHSNLQNLMENIFGKELLKNAKLNNIEISEIKSELFQFKPLSVFIPKEYGGRGSGVQECLTVLETVSYYSLSLSLILGINGALFLQPLSIYGQESIKKDVFYNFIENQAMGGLMITEPNYGSDALHMQTAFTKTQNNYHIKGIKHWGGLTGIADYWLLTARRKNNKNELDRDIDMFVHQKSDNGIHVEEIYSNLGLNMIPYGRNRINAKLGLTSRLEPVSTGVKMLLDILHRSRLQFPGMGLGFIKRMMDETIFHCEGRYIGGKMLIHYDQVKARISKLQSYFTTVSAMCAYSVKTAKIDRDLSKADLQANTIKTIVTDYMQEAAQTFLQLVGANGYRFDHIAGKSIIDSRPFQIFEGSNDILYQQISESIIKGMRRLKVRNLYHYLKGNELSDRSATLLKSILNIEVQYTLSQRKLVELGKAISRIISMNFVIEIGDKGFHSNHITNSINQLKQEVNLFINNYKDVIETSVITSNDSEVNWRNFL